MMICKYLHSSLMSLCRWDGASSCFWPLYSGSSYPAFAVGVLQEPKCEGIIVTDLWTGICHSYIFEFHFCWCSKHSLVLSQVSCLIERLRGAARATLPRSQRAIFDVGSAVMEPLLVLVQTYKHQVSNVTTVLKVKEECSLADSRQYSCFFCIRDCVGRIRIRIT